MTTTRLAIASAAVLALTACNTQDNTAEAPAESTTTPAATPTPTPAASSPQSFVDTVAASDMYEIEAAKLAKDMGKSDKVKAFAAMMVKDHTTSSSDLRAAVAAAGNGLAFAPALTPLQQAHLDQLRGAGDNFDAMYAQQQVDGHEAALGLLQAQAQGGTVEQIKTFAAKAVTVVEGHLAEARKLP